MDVARASGTDLASSLRQNTFLTEKTDFYVKKSILIEKKSISDVKVVLSDPSLGCLFMGGALKQKVQK